MKLKDINFGIIQGRLTKSKAIQKFPKNPFKEFITAKKIGYDFIELIAERRINKDNPIWSEKLNLYKKYTSDNNLLIFSACDDFVISNGFDRHYLKYIDRLFDRLSKIKINRVIIPLENKSEVTKKNLSTIIIYLKKITQICYKKKIPYLLIESNCEFSVFKKIKKGVNSKNLFFLYDTGNRAKYFPDVYTDIIKFGHNIKQIHIKDKNDKGSNVILRKGNVDFPGVIKATKKIKSKDFAIVFENNKGSNPEKNAKKNLKFIKNLF